MMDETPRISVNAQGELTIINHPITYLNFSGRPGQFNAEGDRNYHVVLEGEEAGALLGERWNVKAHEPRNDESEGFHSLQIKVGFGGYKPPVIVMIAGEKRTVLGESMVSILDSVDIARFDMVIRPYDHNSGMGTGRSAYLKTAFVTINQDELMMMYGFEPGPIADIEVEVPVV